MGTRSIIGTANDSGFEGRYCHWDGYPTCRGQQLVDTFRELGDVKAVIDWAIRPDAGPEGYWSSYLTPSRAKAVETLPDTVPCELCSGTGTRPQSPHWDPNSSWAKECDGCNGCKNGQARNTDKTDGYCTDNGDGWHTDKDSCGAEWAYLLSDPGITVLFPTYDNGKDTWHRAAFVPWGEDTDWQAIETAVQLALSA